jgi:hypothetical protein
VITMTKVRIMTTRPFSARHSAHVRCRPASRDSDRGAPRFSG